MHQMIHVTRTSGAHQASLGLSDTYIVLPGFPLGPLVPINKEVL